MRRPGRATGGPPRGIGRGRRARRALRQGGEGVAGELNRIVSGWEQVRITPMFGRFGYFVGDEMFGCCPIHPRSHDLWIRLSATDQARALGAAGIRPHRRFAGRGWIECDLESPEVLPRAVRWLRRAHELAVRRTGGPG